MKGEELHNITRKRCIRLDTIHILMHMDLTWFNQSHSIYGDGLKKVDTKTDDIIINVLDITMKMLFMFEYIYIYI